MVAQAAMEDMMMGGGMPEQQLTQAQQQQDFEQQTAADADNAEASAVEAKGSHPAPPTVAGPRFVRAMGENSRKVFGRYIGLLAV